VSAIPNPFGPKVCFCEPHLVGMKGAIKAAGLWERVSKTPADLEARIAKRNPYDPDPLALLQNMLMGKCRHTAAMNGAQLWDQCPICYFDVSGWIDEAAAAVKTRLVTLDEDRQADIERSHEIERAQR
jgi:hypothetical protein